MRTLAFDLVLAVCLVAALWWINSPAPVPPGPDVPTPAKPERLFGLDRSVPPTMAGRRRDALQLAAVADCYADVIAFDGTRDEPRIVDTATLGERFSSLNNYAFRGRRLTTPELEAVTAEVVVRELESGDEATPLTPELRARAVDIFRAIAWALRQVEESDARVQQLYEPGTECQGQWTVVRGGCRSRRLHANGRRDCRGDSADPRKTSAAEAVYAWCRGDDNASDPRNPISRPA